MGGDSFESQMVSIRYAQRHLATEIARVCEYDFGQYLAARQPYLNSDQIRSLLKQGFSIGAHSVDHPLYADLPLKEQTRQTVESIRFLVEHFELDHRAFAFPHSDAGVREEFFKEMRDKRQLEVSFGTAGMRRHFFRWNLERFSMENSSLAGSSNREDELLARSAPENVCVKLFLGLPGRCRGRWGTALTRDRALLTAVS